MQMYFYIHVAAHKSLIDCLGHRVLIHQLAVFLNAPRYAALSHQLMKGTFKYIL